MKNHIILGASGALAFVAALTLGMSSANAQVSPTTCPSATVFYTNGYSLNPCVPSYYPGYPQITVYGSGYYGNSYSNGSYYTPGYTTTQTNPFMPPVASNNGLFQSAPTYTAPTYYYPPVQNYGYTTTTYGGNGYNNGYGNGYGYSNGYGSGYNNGYYGGNSNGGYNNGYYYGR